MLLLGDIIEIYEMGVGQWKGKNLRTLEIGTVSRTIIKERVKVNVALNFGDRSFVPVNLLTLKASSYPSSPPKPLGISPQRVNTPPTLPNPSTPSSPLDPRFLEFFYLT